MIKLRVLHILYAHKLLINIVCSKWCQELRNVKWFAEENKLSLIDKNMCYFEVLYRYNGQVIVTGNICICCTVIRLLHFK